MKFLKLYCFIFLLIAEFSFSQTEKETINFLNSKLALYTTPMVSEPAYFKVRTGEDHGKVILIDLFISGNLLTTLKFHCDQIDGLTTMRAGNGNLCLKLVSSKGLILRKFASENEERFISEENMPLQTSDEEVFRIKKAFEHLFKLNGMAVTNDNLFKN